MVAIVFIHTSFLYIKFHCLNDIVGTKVDTSSNDKTQM